MNGFERMLKRAFDIVASFLGLILLSPIILYVYIRLKRQDDGPVIYRQERIGYKGKKFDILKFRTMTTDSEQDGIPQLAEKDDNRLTPVGKFLREHHLDELPQLWNVFVGDMSLVGPRPEVERYVRLYTPEQRQVLSVRPGITDWASIEYVDENVILGQAEDPDKAYIEQIMPDKIRYNMKWIKNQGIVEYFRIIFVTFWGILR